MPTSVIANPAKQDKPFAVDHASMVKQSENFQRLKRELVNAVKQSLTGITNLVVGHEDPIIVKEFLRECYRDAELYNSTSTIDVIELQRGGPGKGFAVKAVDELIYGTFELKTDASGVPDYVVDPATGKRKRQPDGFINRKQAVTGEATDRVLILNNVDYSLDFCKEKPGEVDTRASWIFDMFRNPDKKLKMRLLLVTNKKLILPFRVRVVEFRPVSEYEAGFVIRNFEQLYEKYGFTINITKAQKEQIARKLSSLNYTEASDAFSYALSRSEYPKDSMIINVSMALKNLRERINKNFMEDGQGLSHLTPRPWEDYICPKSSNFTYDVEKMLRDFSEIKKLREQAEENIAKGIDESEIERTIEAITMKIPHVIVLYGKGGTGKSAMPVHLAGLLDWDIWDFNINATHSKWIGEGSKQMRDSLKKISNASHIVIRIDEYDRAIGASGESGMGMHEAHKQVESEFMNFLQNSQEEGLLRKNNIILVLTTNHKENITGPLLRSGRSDLVIDIGDFDSESMEITFNTSARRMHNRGVRPMGFKDQQDFQKAIDILDLKHLSELATLKGFTVRDIEILLMEMASHAYYYKVTNGKEGLAWTNENFVAVMEHSEGSVKEEGTGELILGDRWMFQQKNKKDTVKKDDKVIYDPSKMKDIEGFEEK